MLYKSYSFLIILFLLLGSCNLKRQGSLKESNAEVVADSVSHVLADTASIQFIIPFDNVKGVPFETLVMGDFTDYIIPGFEIDEEERFYFLSGDMATLACFEGEKEIFKKKYEQFGSNQLHLFEGEFVVFDNLYGRNNLFHLDKRNGSVLRSFERITENRVNNYHFQDSVLTLAVFDIDEQVNIDSEMAYIQYNLTGMLEKTGANLYALTDKQRKFGYGYEFLGYWKGQLIFWDIDLDMKDGYHKYEFILISSQGRILSKKSIDMDFLGESLYGKQGNPQEHRKLRNEKIYVLARKGNNAVITVLPLAGLFPGID